ncbi:MAG TPA: 23S rRNA pseudouridine(1911/1915/1917) synthase RluD [Xanthomonadaceae bacterium]|nr:23S rRNA pseudouridine(1911/1915/1917) synthase RluD [Xanthomonadaceae bacterium]
MTATPNPSVEPLEAAIPVDFAGRRLDQVLAEIFPDYSRSRLSDWIKHGQALLEGAQVKPRHLVRGGELVTLVPDVEPDQSVQPQPMDLDIRFEDEHILVLHKPAGLVVHPGAGQRDGTLQNGLLAFDAGLARVPRAGIVHRLDKDTSGLMVVARTLAAHAALVAALSARDIHRDYLAVVFGTLVAGGTVDAPIARHPTDRLRMAVMPGGRDAVTHYRVSERFAAHTLLEVSLETGRTHQIRVHMAYIQHPLVGDPQYGGGLRLPRGASPTVIEALRAFRRQALHAWRLGFVHPVTGAPVAIEAPPPADFSALLEALRAAP